LGVHAVHTFLVQTSPLGQVEHDFDTPQPRLTAAQPVARPASMAWAHVSGVQQLPRSHTSVPVQVPQETAGPHPLFTWPQVAVPQLGGVHGVQTLFTQAFAPVHAAHVTVPLPQAFGIEPQSAPPALVHSGGGVSHTPAMHELPDGQEQERV
jgi:hypothetical protein